MQHDLIKRYRNYAHRMSGLPKRLVSLQDQEHSLSEFVLHDLCDGECFNIKKAAFLVDNPDFDILKGVAGFHHGHNYKTNKHWDEPEEFSAHMKNSAYNQKVKSICKCSHKKSGKNLDHLIEQCAQELEFEKPEIVTWNLKNYNHGILLFEVDQKDDIFNDHFEDLIHMLSFCPVL